MDDFLAQLEKDEKWHQQYLRSEGRERERKVIAKRMKQTNMFTDEFISEMTKVEIKSVKRMKVKKVLDEPCG